MSDEIKRTEREAIHDAEIAPLVSKIIEICHAHKIPMVASFALDGPGHPGLRCTTTMLSRDGPTEFKAAAQILTEGLVAFAVRAIPVPAKGKPS